MSTDLLFSFAGHRGTGCTDSTHAHDLNKYLSNPAENTLRSFAKALASPISAAMIETDLIRTKDDRLVLTHSTDFLQHVRPQDRPTGKNFIDQLTLAEVKKLKIGHEGTEQIPTLQELLSFVTDKHPGNGLILNLELKDVQGTACPRRQPSLVDLALAEIKEVSFPLNRIRFSSFSLDIMAELVAKEPHARAGMLFNEYAAPQEDPVRMFVDGNEVYRQFNIDEINEVLRKIPALEALHPEIGTLTAETVAYAATKGLAIATWGWLEESPLQSPIFEEAALNAAALCARAQVPLTFITDYVVDMRTLITKRATTLLAPV